MSDAEEIFPALKDKHPSVCTVEELEEKYWDDVAPDMRAAGMDPETDRPTHQWLSANGHRGLIYALSEYHDTTFGEFWAQTLGLEAGDAGYNWAISDDETIDALESYIKRRIGRRWSEQTATAHRGRLNRYVRAYHAVTGSEAVLRPVSRESDTPAHEAVDACWATFDRLDADEDLARRTLGRIFRSVTAWYDHLVNRRVAALNPASGLGDEYDWSRDKTDDGPSNPPLAPNDVRALYDAASTNEQRFLVVALCAWGLRSGEVARLHRDQIHLDDEHPHVAFDERKNGPSTVNIVFGEHDAKVRLSRLRRRDGWNGYLFPSNRSKTGHVHHNTVRNRFHDLAKRADVDENVVPQMGRRFWYDRYSTTMDDLLEHVQEIADEQGSASPQVVLENYLSDERKRALRREFMRERLADAFDDDGSSP